MSGKVLITGATGFIGYAVARALVRRGDKPRCMVRRMRRGLVLSGLDVEMVVADLESPESLPHAVEGVETVYHFGARATFEPYEVLKPSLVDGSRALMEAAAKAGAKRFVFASSLLVYGNTTTPIGRSTPPAPFVEYGKAKVEAERRMAEAAKANGVSFAAVRLPHVYGPNDLVFSDIALKDRVLNPGSGDKLYGHLHVEDAARALIACGDQGFDGALPVADDHNASWQEFFDVVQRHYPRLRVVNIPPWFAKCGAAMLKPYQYFVNRPTLYTADAVRSWDASLPVEPRVLWQELGMEPLYPSIYEGVPAVLDACVSHWWRPPQRDHL